MAKQLQHQQRRPAAMERDPIARHAHPTPDQLLSSTLVQRCAESPQHLNPAEILTLQRTIGNAAVQRILAGGVQRNTPHSVQTKLIVSDAGDRYEQEADRVASAIVGHQPQVAAARPAPDTGSRAQRQASRAAGEEGGHVEHDLEQRIRQGQSGGSQMPDTVRRTLEPHFGADLSSVKVHTDGGAAKLTQKLGAAAFTHRNHIYYGKGHSPHDVQLTAHETAHTVQQGAVKMSGSAPQTHSTTGMPDAQRARVSQRTGHAAIQRFHMEEASGVKKKSTPFISGGVVVGKDKDDDDVLDYGQQVSKGKATVRVSDDGTAAVEDASHPKAIFTEKSALEGFNKGLEKAKSWYRLMHTGMKIKVKDEGGKTHTLIQTFPINLRTHTAGPTMITKQLCNLMAEEVAGGSLHAKFKPGSRAKEIEESKTTGTRRAGFIATMMVKEMDKDQSDVKEETEYTPDKVEDRLRDAKEEELTSVAKVAKDLGINQHTPIPEIGDAYVTYSGGDYESKGKWNYHWGGVVGVRGSDVITLENYARTGELQEVFDKSGKVADFSPGAKTADAIDTRFFFQMYGTEKYTDDKDQTAKTRDRSFHTASTATGDFVNPITLLTGKNHTEGDKVDKRVPVAREYLQVLTDSVTADWEMLNARKMYQNWHKLPMIVSRIVDSFDRQIKTDEENRSTWESKKKDFLREINDTLPRNDTGKRDKKSLKEMLPFVQAAHHVLMKYVMSA